MTKGDALTVNSLKQSNRQLFYFEMRILSVNVSSFPVGVVIVNLHVPVWTAMPSTNSDCQYYMLHLYLKYPQIPHTSHSKPQSSNHLWESYDLIYFQPD